MIHKLLQLETVVLESGSLLLKDLAALGRTPAACDEGAFSQRLLQLVADTERLTAAIEKSLPQLAPEDGDLALGSIERVRHTWADIRTSIERVGVLAAQGRLDERFGALSAMAAEHDPLERLGLEQLTERLHAVARRKAPSPPEEETSPAEEPPPDEPAPSARSPEDDTESPTRRPFAAPTAALPPMEVRSPQLDYVFWPAEGAPNPVEDQNLADCLGRVGTSDQLDTHAALTELLGRHRSRFVSLLVEAGGQKDPALERILRAVWEEPELLLVSDHLSPAGAIRLLPLLARAGAYPEAAGFGRLLGLFRASAFPDTGLLTADTTPADREILLRALLVHPLSSYRGYAISQLDPVEVWPLLACPEIPVVPLIEIVDRLSLEDVPTDHQKVFLDSAYPALAGSRAPLEVQAAGYVLERAARFEFAVEDGYYRKLMQLAEILGRVEEAVSAPGSYSRQAAALLQRRKDLSGAQATRPPASFAGVPLALQRKLARQGLYVNLFVRHPDPRVALETLRFIDNPVKAEAVAKLPTTNRLVIAEIAKRDELLKTYGARLALLAHPRASLEAAQKYAAFLKAEDLEQLTQQKSVNPEVALYLREQLGQKRSPTEH